MLICFAGMLTNALAVSLKDAQCACEVGYGKACYDVSYMYIEGTSEVKQDPTKALPFLLKSCELNYAMGCHEAADVYSTIGDMGQADAYVKAFEFYNKACSLDGSRACSNVGFMYLNAQGVKQDMKKAAEYARKACLGGSEEGCLTIANRYYKGEGVLQDYDTALSYFKMACEGGVSTACYTLGNMYDDGKGTMHNADKSISYYEKSCDDKGDEARGCAILASLYEEGNGGFLKDTQKAKVFYTQACQKAKKDPKFSNDDLFVKMKDFYCKRSDEL